MSILSLVRTAAMCSLCALPAAPALAQTGSIELELNTATDGPDGCRLTYVATNGSGAALQAMSYEVAVFDGAGTVSRLLLLEFGALPLNKTRVLQFDLPGMACGSISRLLVNSQEECTTAEGPVDLCMARLVASSRLPKMAFGQ